MKYLVTGASGFIGRHLADFLASAGHEVTGADSKPLSTPASGWRFEQGSILDFSHMCALSASCDGIFHMAAIASVGASVEDPRFTHETNVGGTLTLFEAARTNKNIPVVYASSAAVYGDNPDLPLSETAPLSPLSPYAAHKCSNELDAAAYGAAFELPSFGLRFFNVYGPGQDPKSPYSGVISIFCERLKNKQPITIFGDGRQSRDFIAVSDVIHAVVAAMDNAAPNAPVANVCRGEQTTLLDLAENIGQILSFPPELIFKPARAADIVHSCGNPARLQKLTGFQAGTNLNAGLRALLYAA
ncbi:MAG: NAD-dependent epimerase/dehydratase family protein [Alphaproteobacteria bacterium]|nr:NAD-dependent epimerase/dehydratase family protein [Alphaproteobacteria bacterium]